MMSLLADKKDIVDYLPSPSKVAPLVIHFSSGCVPNGCFGNVISCFISKYNWKVCQTEQGKPECLAHNIVTLRDPTLPVTITIVNHIQHLEVHISMAKVKKHFSEICSSIQTSTFSAIENVFKVMWFEDTQVEPAFLCPCKCSSSHAATVCHFLYGLFAPKQEYWLVACKRNSSSGFRKRKVRHVLFKGFIEFVWHTHSLRPISTAIVSSSVLPIVQRQSYCTTADLFQDPIWQCQYTGKNWNTLLGTRSTAIRRCYWRSHPSHYRTTSSWYN